MFFHAYCTEAIDAYFDKKGEGTGEEKWHSRSLRGPTNKCGVKRGVTLTSVTVSYCYYYTYI